MSSRRHAEHMVLCNGCCPAGTEVVESEARFSGMLVELPCFCELCNQMIDVAPRVVLRSVVRGAFLLEGGAWRRLFVDRLNGMAMQPELWARTRGEFVAIVITWMEVMVYAGEATLVPSPDRFYERRNGRVVSMDEPPDHDWVAEVVDRVMGSFSEPLAERVTMKLDVGRLSSA